MIDKSRTRIIDGVEFYHGELVDCHKDGVVRNGRLYIYDERTHFSFLCDDGSFGWEVEPEDLCRDLAEEFGLMYSWNMLSGIKKIDPEWDYSSEPDSDYLSEQRSKWPNLYSS